MNCQNLTVLLCQVRHLQLHQSFDVINARRFPFSVCGTKCLFQQVLLLPLDLHHVLLHRILHNELQSEWGWGEGVKMSYE